MSVTVSRFSLTVMLVNVLIVTVTITASFPGMATAQTNKDSATVYAMVESYQSTWNTHESAALAGFFTKDADMVIGNLPAMHGRQAIQKWWQKYFAQQESERKLTIAVNSIRHLADDVELVNVGTITGGKDTRGVEFHERKARGTWLLRRHNSSWLISALQAMPTEKDSIVLRASMETAESLRPDIRAFVYAYEDAFDSHDPSAVSAFFRNDADIIIRNSPLIKGIKAVQDWWRDYFSNPRPYKVIFIINEIQKISDDVVQINVTGTGAVSEAKYELRPVRQSNAVWILVRKDSKWHIAALRVLPGKDDRIIRESDF